MSQNLHPVPVEENLPTLVEQNLTAPVEQNLPAPVENLPAPVESSEEEIIVGTDQEVPTIDSPGQGHIP